MASYQEQVSSTVDHILRIQEVEAILFPAKMAIAPDKFLKFETPADYTFPSIPDEFHTEHGFIVLLESGNEIRFRFTGFYSSQAIPSTIVIQFLSEHLENEIFSSDLLQTIV